LLSIENVSLSFGGVRAIRDVSFDIKKGEVRAIIGPNGAGKTSMLNVINGFYQPQRGRITFKGRTRSKMRPYDAARGGIARTFQNVALFKGMTALENIMAGVPEDEHGFLWQLAHRPGAQRGDRASPPRRGNHRLGIRRPQGAGGPAALRFAEARRRPRSPWVDLLCSRTVAGMNLEEGMSRFIIDVNISAPPSR
jgi:branched-chain amino acid transport system ATP-binding protein